MPSPETLSTRTDQEHKQSTLQETDTTNKESLDQLLTNSRLKFKSNNNNQFTRPTKSLPDQSSDPKTAESFTNTLTMMSKSKDWLEFQPLLNTMFLFTSTSTFQLKSHATHVVAETTKDSELIKLSMLPMSTSTKEENW